MNVDSRPGRRLLPITLCGMLLIPVMLPAAVDAQDDQDKPAATAAEEAQESEAKAEAEDEKEADPFALPEGADAEALFNHIRKVKTMQGRTLESVTKAAKAAAAAAGAIRQLEDVSLEDELRALQEQMSALNFLQRFDPASRQAMQDLVTSLKEDERPEIRRIAEMEAFKSKLMTAGSASEKEQQELIDQLKTLTAESEFDRETYGLYNSVASVLTRSGANELAASVYEEMAARMRESSDEAMQERASRMMGAARRTRLPGNKMEIEGTTTSGEAFDWESYRGKVVLVDFWASWCGPCRAEIPNMKRNLEQYGEKGFAIVGVNLDRTLEACEEYVKEEELTWTNLISNKEGEMGWDNPLAVYYGVSGIPTAILVDQEGKVVSLSARGAELDRLLADMLGEPEAADGKEKEETP